MVSKYKKSNIEQAKRRAYVLYKTGASLRDVGKIVNRSYEWVRAAVKNFEKKIDKPV